MTELRRLITARYFGQSHGACSLSRNVPGECPRAENKLFLVNFRDNHGVRCRLTHIILIAQTRWKCHERPLHLMIRNLRQQMTDAVQAGLFLINRLNHPSRRGRKKTPTVPDASQSPAPITSGDRATPEHREERQRKTSATKDARHSANPVAPQAAVRQSYPASGCPFVK